MRSQGPAPSRWGIGNGLGSALAGRIVAVGPGGDSLDAGSWMLDAGCHEVSGFFRRAGQYWFGISRMISPVSLSYCIMCRLPFSSLIVFVPQFPIICDSYIRQLLL